MRTLYIIFLISLRPGRACLPKCASTLRLLKTLRRAGTLRGYINFGDRETHPPRPRQKQQTKRRKAILAKQNNTVEESIRTLKPSDLSAVLAMQDRAYVPDLHEPPELYTAMIAAKGGVAITSVNKGVMNGYLFAYPVQKERDNFYDGPRDECDEGVIYLHDLAIDPAVQGSGIGKALYEAFEARAKEMGMHTVIATAIDGRLEFWEKQGFHSISETRYHGVLATRIEKDLNP